MKDSPLTVPIHRLTSQNIRLGTSYQNQVMIFNCLGLDRLDSVSEFCNQCAALGCRIFSDTITPVSGFHPSYSPVQ